MPSTKLWKRVALGATALTGLGLLGYAFRAKAVPVHTAVVTRGALLVTVDEEGKTGIRERYTVSAPLAGDLARIRLKAGNPVQSGQTLLATIEPVDPALLDARSRAQAEAKLKAAETAFSQAKTNLAASEAAEDFAQSEFKRVKQLVESRTRTQQEFERVEMELRMRVEELRSAEFAVQIAEFERELAEAALMRTKRRVPPDTAFVNGLKVESVDGKAPATAPEETSPATGDSSAVPDDEWRIEIRSPIDGRVLRVHQESAAVVPIGEKLLDVGNPSDLEIEVDVLSTDAVKIASGARVLIEQWGGAQTLEGRVRLVEPAAFTKISALGVEEQRVWVKIDFVDPPEKLPPLGDGFRVEARVVTWEGRGVLKIPTSSLLRHEDRWAVFRVVNGRAQRQPVEIGHRNNFEVELLSGLEDGDVLIEHPSDKIDDGVRVVRRN